MNLITPLEILYFVILIAVLGFIFTGVFIIRPRTIYDRMHPKKWRWHDFKFAALIASPAIILHELGHKFVAMAYGYSATFQLFPFGLALGIFLKLISSPLMILSPGYVNIGTEAFADPIAYRVIAFAGPAVNLLLFLISWLILKYANNLSRKQELTLHFTKVLNMLLFLFNMIPLGPFDGQKVFFGPPS
ncbi:MAG: M50 family metallopeptidase [DPANN group archaeon]|nr:M50 family metallopeptidase [DPANN group archaeon]